MILPPDTRIRLVRTHSDDADWLDTLATTNLESSGVLLKQEPGASVWRARLCETNVVLKCRTMSPVDRARERLGASRELRHWRGATWLNRNGIRAALPLALVVGQRGEDHIACLVLEALEGPTLLEIMSRISRGEGPSVRSQHVLAREIGQQIAQMQLAGRYNRDHKPSNLIVTHLTDEEAEVALIDTGAIRRRGRHSLHVAILRMLGSLIIEPTGLDVAPRRTLRMRVLTEAVELYEELRWGTLSGRGYRTEAAQLWWDEVTRLLESHGDPTPKVNPLRPGPHSDSQNPTQK